jgi:hypothetical protein
MAGSVPEEPAEVVPVAVAFLEDPAGEPLAVLVPAELVTVLIGRRAC